MMHNIETTTIDVEKLKSLVYDLSTAESEIDDAVSRLTEHREEVSSAFSDMNELLSKIERLGMSIGDARETADKSLTDVVDGY